MTIMPKYNTGFGLRLKEAISKSKMSQRELAQKLAVHEGSISRWISKSRYPDLFKAYEISEYLEVSLDWLIKGKAHDVNLSVFQVKEPLQEYGNKREQTEFFFSEEEISYLLGFMELDSETRRTVMELIERIALEKREGKNKSSED